VTGPVAEVRTGPGGPPAPAPEVSVIVLVLDDSRLALRCLDSLATAGGGIPFETIVVANGTTEAGLRALEGRRDVILLRSRVNLGFAGGVNLAADVARGRYLLLLNDDSTVSPGLVDHLVAAVGRDPAIGAVGGRILSEDGSLQEAGSVLWRDGWVAHAGLGLPAGDRSYRYVRDVDYTSANGLLVRADAFRDVGGLDEGYFPAYYEDVDLCMSLRDHGYRVVFEPRAEVVHLESQSTSSGFRNFLLTRNRRRFTEKWAGPLAHLDPKPDPIDGLAIERGVHRARGRPPRVLVAAGPGPDTTRWDLVESLAARGWAVTVAPGPTAGPAGAVAVPVAIDDRLVDLGVDVRSGDWHEALRATGHDIEAVIVGTGTGGPPPTVLRPDGTEAPVLPPAGADGADLGVEAVDRVARRRPDTVPRVTGVEAVTERGRSTGWSAHGPGPVPGLPEREQAALEAERRVRDQYTALLERQLDAKNAYLASRWSLRAKKWLTALPGRLRTRGPVPGGPVPGGAAASPGRATVPPNVPDRSEDAGRPERPLRILVVADLFPWPATGGGLIRLAGMIEAVSGLGDVDLFAVSDRDQAECVPPPSVALRRLRTVRYPSSRPGWRWRTAWLTQAREPIEVVMRSSDPAFRRAFTSWVAEEYDLVWFSTAAMYAWTGRPRLGPTIIDLMDLEDVKAGQHSDLIRDAGSTGGITAAARGAVASAQAAKNAHDWRALQRSVSRDADRVLLASEADVRRSGLANAVAIPNTYPRPDRSLGRPEVADPPVILLQGRLNYTPNMDAVNWLLDDVAPHLWTRVPDARIRLVGKSPPGVRRRDRPPAVTVVGLVPDMATELAVADLAVVPLRMGSGTRLKILESFSHRIPVVSTTIGADGLDVRDGEHLLLADDAASFAEACHRLLTDTDLRVRLVDAAERLYLEHYASEAAEARVLALVREVARRGR